MKVFSIAIDGPAGAGKSTIAKMLAKRLNCIYIDTGAMYRSIGYYCILNQINYEDEMAVTNALDSIKLEMRCTKEGQMIFLNGQNISDCIRTDAVAASASKVATYGAVRTEMVKRQQQMAKAQSVVMDGRDIGTVVLKDATLKIFLTASVDERAKRRYKEYTEKGLQVDLKVLEEEIKLRDAQDSQREISPLKVADDAILVDTTHLGIEAIVDKINQLLEERL